MQDPFIGIHSYISLIQCTWQNVDVVRFFYLSGRNSKDLVLFFEFLVLGQHEILKLDLKIFIYRVYILIDCIALKLVFGYDLNSSVIQIMILI